MTNKQGFLVISLVVYQDFDRGDIVEQFAPTSLDLQPGDRINWGCGSNHSGTAEIVGVGEKVGIRVWVKVRKIK